MRRGRALVWNTMRKVPIWMVEPSLRVARVAMAPSTHVPLSDPRSSIVA